MNTYTAREAAEKLGRPKRTVLRWCKRLGVKWDGRQFQITAREFQQIRDMVREGPGNPRFGESDFCRAAGLAYAAKTSRKERVERAKKAAAASVESRRRKSC